MTIYKTTKQQSGMTFIGIVFIFIFAGIFAMAGLKLLPLYMENLAVKKSIESIQEEYKGETSVSPKKIRSLMQNKFNVQSVNSLKAKDVVIKKARGGYTVDASYSPKVNYIGNVNFVIDFEHKFELEK